MRSHADKEEARFDDAERQGKVHMFDLWRFGLDVQQVMTTRVLRIMAGELSEQRGAWSPRSRQPIVQDIFSFVENDLPRRTAPQSAKSFSRPLSETGRFSRKTGRRLSTNGQSLRGIRDLD